jgi:hypothetical protein
MRNDVHPPPLERPMPPLAAHGREPVMVNLPSRGDGHVPPLENKAPIPPADHLVADVSLFDHPNFEPGGAGNFWILGIIGMAIFGVAALVVALLWLGKHT